MYIHIHTHTHVYIYIHIYIYIPSGPQVSARGGVGWGGVGWGMSTSCRSYVDVTLMGWGGVGWGGALSWQPWNSSGNCLCPACSLPAKFGTRHRGNFEKTSLWRRDMYGNKWEPLKKLTVNRRNFTNTFKFTANTNRIYTPCHITPRPAVKNNTCKTFQTDNLTKSPLSCGKSTTPDSDVMPLTCHNMQGARA